MAHFAKATKAKKPHSQTAKVVAWVYAAVIVIMLIAQLVAFEKFIPLMSDYKLVGGHGTATLVACLIVFTEVFSIPFLLRMALSPLMRWMSLICGLLVATLWSKLAFVGLMGTQVHNSGLLGADVTLNTGAAQAIVALVLVVLAVWSAWGLRPQYKV